MNYSLSVSDSIYGDLARLVPPISHVALPLRRESVRRLWFAMSLSCVGQLANKETAESGNVEFNSCIPVHNMCHDQIVAMGWSRKFLHNVEPTEGNGKVLDVFHKVKWCERVLCIRLMEAIQMYKNRYLEALSTNKRWVWWGFKTKWLCYGSTQALSTTMTPSTRFMRAKKPITISGADLRGVRFWERMRGCMSGQRGCDVSRPITAQHNTTGRQDIWPARTCRGDIDNRQTMRKK